MNKVLIELHIPAISEHFDIFVPIDVPIGTLSKIIADGVAEISDDSYVISGYEQLCLRDPTGLLSPRCSLQDYGIKDGMQLYLI